MSITVATVNVNGIRAAAKVRNEDNHGILPWLESTPAEVVLLQEVRATPEQTQKALAPALEAGWHLVQAEAAAKGRAGVAVLSRHAIEDVQVGFGEGFSTEFDDAGRYIEATTAGLRVASVYLPSGAEGTAKQDEKFRFLDVFGPYLEQQAAVHPQMVVGGDWNICHRRQDLKNWRPNRKKSGFLPSERAFMDSVFGTFPDGATQVGDPTDAGRTGNPAGQPSDYVGAVEYVPAGAAPQAAQEPRWFDALRRLHPDEDGPYSWWTWRGKAFDTGAGWRIDYQAATSDLMDRVEAAWVDRAEHYDLRWSDHSPVLVTYS
ncbi:MAG: exodeoxyribonuclease III [Corynebacterium sp.]|uniref:exodeoxyribonuclease III n=1 Tax=unclassified Corynebacterium TaxID=2624378 RepID=UPI0026480E17|nr:exodeoxyribonuclease III [Corynebacterium sp.]MDN5582619.1 exodeoxyribonuclease III [Corynebacterium sp.]MDN5719412.1 exodeoxyribonuclease III [Corynebacterium sp.]